MTLNATEDGSNVWSFGNMSVPEADDLAEADDEIPEADDTDEEPGAGPGDEVILEADDADEELGDEFDPSTLQTSMEGM